jgi:hypothetical protein
LYAIEIESPNFPSSPSSSARDKCTIIMQWLTYNNHGYIRIITNFSYCIE